MLPELPRRSNFKPLLSLQTRSSLHIPKYPLRGLDSPQAVPRPPHAYCLHAPSPPLHSSSPCHLPFHTRQPQITDSNKPSGYFWSLLSWLSLQNWTQLPLLETFSSLTFRCAILDWFSEPPIPFLAHFLIVHSSFPGSHPVLSCLLSAFLPLHPHLPRLLLHLRVGGFH